MSSKKWVITTLSLCFVLLILLGSLTYIIDPLHQYRYSPESGYPLSPQYSLSGLIKNYDYDSVMLGSSMTQNFVSEDFKNEMNLDILKVTMGGMSFPDIKLNMELINKTGKCKTMFIGLDLHKYAETNPVTHLPTYLYNGYTDDYKYVLSSDVYTKFLPLALCTETFNAIDKPVPTIISSKSDPDKMGYWNDEYEFKEEILLESIENNRGGVSDIEIYGLENRLQTNIDEFFTYINEDTEYILFFPPYSAFYWEHCEYNGFLNQFLDAKIYFINKAKKYSNVRVYDFQNIDETIDFSNYKDMTHYRAEINKQMVEWFAEEKYMCKSSNEISNNNKGILQKIQYLKQNYKETLDKSHSHNN